VHFAVTRNTRRNEEEINYRAPSPSSHPVTHRLLTNPRTLGTRHEGNPRTTTELTDDAGADDGVDEVERRHRDGAALLLLLLLQFLILLVEVGEMRRQVAVRRPR